MKSLDGCKIGFNKARQIAVSSERTLQRQQYRVRHSPGVSSPKAIRSMTTASGLTKSGRSCVGMQMNEVDRVRTTGGCRGRWEGGYLFETKLRLPLNRAVFAGGSNL